MKCPLRRSRSASSISAVVFMTNGPWRAIGSPSGRAAASRNRPPPGAAAASTRSPSPKTTSDGACAAFRVGAEAHLALIHVREGGVPSRHRLAERRALRQRHVEELGRHREAFHRPGQPPVRRVARDGRAPARRPSSAALGQVASGQVPVLRARHLLARGQVEPELEPPMPSGRTCGISSWRMPLPEVIHWMSPGPMLPRWPSESRCWTSPVRTNVTVSMPRCG